MNIENASNKWAEYYDEVENSTRDLDKSVLQNILPDLKNKIIVEAGCGTGKNTEWMSENAGEIFAFDFSEKMLRVARKKITKSNVYFRQQDLTNEWKYENGFCDIVTINLVLEHIKELQHIFDEAFRVLKNNGKLVICEYHPFRQQQGKSAKFEDNKNDEIVKIDFYKHTKEEFETCGKIAGFENIEFRDWFDENKQEKIPRLLSIMLLKK